MSIQYTTHGDIPATPDSVPFFRTPYNYDTMQASDMSGLECLDESLTIQSAKEDADINTIVRRFGLSGELPNNLNMPVSGDFTGIGDFHQAMNLVRRAEEEFLRVPADVRARFNNDPARFMEFFDDPANADEARRYGMLRDPVPPPEPQLVRVVPEAGKP